MGRHLYIYCTVAYHEQFAFSSFLSKTGFLLYSIHILLQWLILFKNTLNVLEMSLEVNP